MVNHDATEAGLIDISGFDLDKLDPDVDKSALADTLRRFSTSEEEEEGEYRGFSNSI